LEEDVAIRFPDRAVGTLHFIEGDEWLHWAPAQGEISVPADREIGLRVEDCTCLEFLAELPPSTLNGLVFLCRDVDDNVGRLI
jgi:hypothetical protein